MFLLTNARRILAALLFYSGMTIAASPSAAGSSPIGLSLVPLQQGVNNLALAHPTSADFAVLATFENNTSHPNRGLSFYIKTPDGYSLVPLPNSDAFIWFDYRIAASRQKIFDFQLVRYPQGLRLITAEKVGEDLTDAQPVKLQRYVLQESHDDPGVPLYTWHEEKSVVTPQSYEDVDTVLTDSAALCTLLPAEAP
ncbi:CpmJ protein [Candidatus Symbiopectobacterium sp. NZEC127]|uniref:carbapenem self-resistance protein CarG family protein n=1 Tax=Candidatus Symbiopectobacterium sp. NZEC127 TaxID=2820472 RepID=UPI00222804F5|nr:CpmJ protein [Candidatus Symbiopectobacterium sp. NZEC127]MCW2488258.1 CpmJ protein [Candidatus Symbiopectobacterium sp. NZEC127]